MKVPSDAMDLENKSFKLWKKLKGSEKHDAKEILTQSKEEQNHYLEFLYSQGEDWDVIIYMAREKILLNMEQLLRRWDGYQFLSKKEWQIEVFLLSQW